MDASNTPVEVIELPWRKAVVFTDNKGQKWRLGVRWQDTVQSHQPYYASPFLTRIGSIPDSARWPELEVLQDTGGVASTPKYYFRNYAEHTLRRVLPVAAGGPTKKEPGV